MKTHTSPQNGVVEWFNQIILEIIRALLFNIKISKLYQKYAVATTNYLQNYIILIHDSVDKDKYKKILYKLWFSYKPDLSYLRAQSCYILYYNNIVKNKLDSYILEDIFIIYRKSNRQYYILFQEKSKIKLVINPKFYK